MSRSLPLVAALGLALAGSGCTKAKAGAAAAHLRQPQAIAAFQGRTLGDASAIRPYLAIANAARNDVTIMDAEKDVPVYAPVALRTLVLPVESRPSLLAAASLGDDVPASGGTPAQRHADLLVAVAGGDSVVQVVETWLPANAVHFGAPDDLSGLAVDLGHAVLALAPVPSAKGTARIAALLADRLVAIVEYRRSAADGEAIERVGGVVSTTPLPFEPAAIAAMPDDPAVDGIQTALYVATRDPLLLGAPTANPPIPPTYGVAELSVADLNAAPRVLGARAPTRLVAAARLLERFPGSAESGTGAFPALSVAPVPRVYAVLDESGCGSNKPIDCGVVVLDPNVASGAMAIPPDYAGLMPHRAPMRIPGRPLAIAISGPPENPLGDVAGETGYPAGFMRIYMGAIGRATTAVAAVASDNGSVYFLDLGRFEVETQAPVVAVRSNSASQTLFATPPVPEGTIADANDDVRLWIQKPDGTFADPANTSDLFAAITTTPGFTPDESWTVRWQGWLSLDLLGRFGEVATDAATTQLALALQRVDRSDPATPPVFSQVVRLWHPSVGVHDGDILVFKVGRVPPAAPLCAGTAPPLPPGTTTSADLENEFEIRVGTLLPPSDAHPGGAVTLVRPPDSAPEWQACYDAVAGAATGANVVSDLRVTVRASGLVLTGAALGYLGRPELGASPGPSNVPAGIAKPFALQYPATAPAAPWAEDALVAACPVADWDGTFPPASDAVLTCDAACRTACEQLVLARKSRRLDNVSVDCATNPSGLTACAGDGTTANPGRWPPAQYPFPVVNGPMLGFQVAVQRRGGPTGDPAKDSRTIRDMRLELSTSSGAAPILARESSTTSPYEPNGAIAFDRTRWTTPADGYRFFVSYPADFVLDATPSQSGSNSRVPAAVIK